VLVSHKYKMVFIHIPKTGGSSVRQMMAIADPECHEHNGHHDAITQSDAFLFKDYFKFTVVRNSYKLCASYYRYMTEKILNSKEWPQQRQEASGLVNLLKGQLTITEESNDWQIHEAQNSFPVQLDYFSEEGEVLVDKIFMYDKGLDIEMFSLKRKINFHGELIQKNYFGEYDWKSYYNAESVEYVKQLCRKDIEYFGFKFE
jgi:chondroitin 4-sulfotransferase 11